MNYALKELTLREWVAANIRDEEDVMLIPTYELRVIRAHYEHEIETIPDEQALADMADDNFVSTTEIYDITLARNAILYYVKKLP